jgi:GNAT superfamily N-acetyltransferase
MNTIVTLKRYSQRFREEYRRRPVSELGHRILSHLARKSFETNTSCWFHLSLRDQFDLVKPKIPVQFGFMQFDEAVRFFRQNHHQFPWMYLEKEMQVAAECGHRFPSFSVDKRVVAYLKVGVTKAYVLDFDEILHLPAGVAIYYDGFVAPEFRCKKLGSAILSKTAQSLQQEGFKAVFTQVALWNIPSRTMNLLAGHKPVGQTRYIRLFGRRAIWNHPKNFPLRFEVNDRREKELRLGIFPGS